MSDTSIEMTWSTFEGAVEYHLHRVPKTSEDEPGTELMTSDNRLHVATDIGRFVDDGVETGARYWYGIKALDSDGVLMAHGWHRADAVTDEEPPSPVGNLQVVLEGGEVLVSWDRPDENYELHSYQVLRGVDGEEPQVISNTWNLDQRSFIDDRPPVSGTVTYLVTSLDYHWNTSDPAEVTIDLPQ